MKLRTRFLLIGLVLVLLPTVGVSVSSYRQYRFGLEASNESAMRVIAHSYLEKVDTQLLRMETSLSQTIYSTNLKNYISMMDFPDIDAKTNYRMTFNLMAELDALISNLRGQLKSLGFYWLNDNFMLSREASGSIEDVRAWVSEMNLKLNQRRWVYNDPIEGRTALVSLFTNGYTPEPLGAAVFWINVSQLLPFQPDPLASRRIVVMTEQHQVIYDSQSEWNGQPCPWEELLAAPSDSFDFTRGGLDYWVISLPSSVNGWRVVTLMSKRDMYQSLQTIPLIVFFTTLLCCALMCIAILLQFQWIYQPVKQLSQAMEQFGAGRYGFRLPEGRRDEFGTLIARYNEMARRIEDNTHRQQQDEEEKRTLEYRFLNAQIMPHFLMNTLMTVKVLARRGDTEQIERLIRPLLELLRAVKSPSLTVTLEEEIQYVLQYVDIMKVRYQTQIAVETRIDPQLLRQVIPKFLIQPLVENSVLHAFDEDCADPRITLSAYAEGNALCVVVADNGKGMTPRQLQLLMEHDDQPQDNKLSSIGVANVARRIRLEYGQAYGLAYRSDPGHGTRVTLRLPLGQGGGDAA